MHRLNQCFSHGKADALTKPLGKLQPDIDMAVRCVTNRTKDGLSTTYLSGGVDGLSGGRIPLLFEDQSAGSYRKDRHGELYERWWQTKSSLQRVLQRPLQHHLQHHLQHMLQC